MIEPLADLLALSAPLAPFAADLAAVWSATATPRTFGAREALFAPADPASTLLVLATGRIKLTVVSTGGKELILALLGRGDLLGHVTPSGAGTHRTFAESLEPGSAWSVPQEAVHDAWRRQPEAALALLQVQDARSRHLEERLAGLVFQEVPQRLAAALLELGNTPEGEVLLTHYDLAGLIGSTRETTTLVLNKFRTAGWVQLDKRKVRLHDPVALAEIVDGTRTIA